MDLWECGNSVSSPTTPLFTWAVVMNLTHPRRHKSYFWCQFSLFSKWKSIHWCFHCYVKTIFWMTLHLTWQLQASSISQTPLTVGGLWVFTEVPICRECWFCCNLFQPTHTQYDIIQPFYRTIEELNSKADQITEGIAALAQIYIDNPPLGYRRSHSGKDTPVTSPDMPTRASKANWRIIDVSKGHKMLERHPSTQLNETKVHIRKE